MRNKVYPIRVSMRTRRKLDALRSGPFGRTPLAHLFHKRYADARPDILRRSGAWATNPRPVLTMVSLHPDQVLEVIELAEEHDIEIKYINPRTGNPTNLLGQFLEAVINDHLVPRT